MWNCKNCAKRCTCTEPCKWLEKELVSVTKKRNWREIIFSDLPDNFEGNIAAGDDDLSPIAPDHAALAGVLTGRQYECYYMRYVDGLTQEDIGSELGIDRTTVSRHIAAAKIKIKKRYKYTHFQQI